MSTILKFFIFIHLAKLLCEHIHIVVLVQHIMPCGLKACRQWIISQIILRSLSDVSQTSSSRMGCTGSSQGRRHLRPGLPSQLHNMTQLCCCGSCDSMHKTVRRQQEYMEPLGEWGTHAPH